MRGRIVQISISKGGVPKLAVPEADVTTTGLVGDGHNNPDIHGGPEGCLPLVPGSNRNVAARGT